MNGLSRIAWLGIALVLASGRLPASAQVEQNRQAEPGPSAPPAAAGTEVAPPGQTADDAGDPEDTAKLPPTLLERLPKDGTRLSFDEAMYVPPKAKRITLPVYPYELLKQGVSGKAQVSCMVDTDGKVIKTTVMKASRPEFGAALAAALEATKFGHATTEGEPVATVLGIEHSFRPRDGDDPQLRRELQLLERVQRRQKLVGRARDLDRPLRVKEQQAPAFPTKHLSRGVGGEALVEFLLDEEGTVRLPRIVWATEPSFGYAAVQAVSAWKFDPPVINGEPVLMRVSAPFKFMVR